MTVKNLCLDRNEKVFQPENEFINMKADFSRILFPYHQKENKHLNNLLLLF